MEVVGRIRCVGEALLEHNTSAACVSTSQLPRGFGLPPLVGNGMGHPLHDPARRHLDFHLVSIPALVLACLGNVTESVEP